MKSYKELVRYNTFDERFKYLQLHGNVGRETFSSMRYLNQAFYTSREWRRLRDYIIVRDCGCDMGLEGYEIQGLIILHHIRPLTVEQLLNMDSAVTDPDNIIATSFATHNAIHYGTCPPCQQPVIRCPGDTTLWKRKVLDD